MVVADAGAITIMSAHRAISTWLFQLPDASFTKSMVTGCLESVERVSGVIKSVAALVIITLTSAPSLTKRRTSKAVL